jgi:hypothetical protein
VLFGADPPIGYQRSATSGTRPWGFRT